MNRILVFRASQSTRTRRTIIALIAVPAILVGLLLMHVLSADGSATPTGVGGSTSATVIVDASADVDCDGPCAPTHSMAEVACILALLVSLILLAAPVSIRRWLVLASPMRFALFDTRAPSAPLTLHELSISRT